jgi:hypothetical protein
MMVVTTWLLARIEVTKGRRGATAAGGGGTMRRTMVLAVGTALALSAGHASAEDGAIVVGFRGGIGGTVRSRDPIGLGTLVPLGVEAGYRIATRSSLVVTSSMPMDQTRCAWAR